MVVVVVVVVAMDVVVLRLLLSVMVHITMALVVSVGGWVGKRGGYGGCGD